MKKYLAELIGTYFLVFCGTGSIVINEVSGGAIGHLGISITFGLIVMAMIYALGSISGAHINPAVSIAFYISGDLDKKELPFYLLYQCMGAILASSTLFVLFPGLSSYGDTVPAFGVMQTFILEIILTFLLMFVILLIANEQSDLRPFAGFVIGLTVLLEALFAGPITGASMNPARSLGPALFSGSLDVIWIYFGAPILGAALAVLAWKNMFSVRKLA